MAQSKVRYAVVGLGYIAQAAVLPSFAHARRNSSLHAIVSGSTEKLNALGDKYRVPVRASYDEYERCLQEVDAVYIATPHPGHAEWAIKAAEAGKHALIEKPMGLTAFEAEAMFDAAKKHGTFMGEAYMYRCHPQTRVLLDLITDGAIGTVRIVKSSFGFAMPAVVAEQKTPGAVGGAAQCASNVA